MIITSMLVLITQARLLVNAFQTAKMTIAARLIVYQHSKMNILNVLVRFVMLIITLFNTFKQKKCPLGCPCDNYNCDLPEKKAILTLYSRGSKPSVLIQPNGKFLSLNFRIIPIQVASLKISNSKSTMTQKFIGLALRH